MLAKHLENFEHILDDYGFDHRTKAQLRHHDSLGRTDLVLVHMCQENRDRCKYEVEGRVVNNGQPEEKVYFNGFSLTVARNMPEKFSAAGLSLQDLELRLLTPPDPLMVTAENASTYKQVLENYRQEIISDLHLLYKANRELCCKLIAMHDPFLDQDLKNRTNPQVKALKDTQVRRQWFPAEKMIPREAAYVMMESISHAKAVYINKLGDMPLSAGTWYKLNYKKKDDNQKEERSKWGNLHFETYHDNYGFIIRECLPNYGFVGFDDPVYVDSKAGELERGKLVEVVPVDQSRNEKVWIFANPEHRTISIINAKGIYLEHDEFLTPAGREARAARKAAHGDGQGASTEEPEHGTKHDARHHPRVIGDNNKKTGLGH